MGKYLLSEKEYTEYQNMKARVKELETKLNEYERAGGILDEGEAWYGLAQRYEQALEEIKYQITELYMGIANKDRPYCEKILNIINNAKDGNDE